MSARKSIDPAKERVKVELHELRERIVKLEAFINSTAITKLKGRMQGLLALQLGYMHEYEDVLEERLRIWDD